MYAVGNLAGAATLPVFMPFVLSQAASNPAVSAYMEGWINPVQTIAGNFSGTSSVGFNSFFKPASYSGAEQVVASNDYGVMGTVLGAGLYTKKGLFAATTKADDGTIDVSAEDLVGVALGGLFLVFALAMIRYFFKNRSAQGTQPSDEKDIPPPPPSNASRLAVGSVPGGLVVPEEAPPPPPPVPTPHRGREV